MVEGLACVSRGMAHPVQALGGRQKMHWDGINTLPAVKPLKSEEEEEVCPEIAQKKKQLHRKPEIAQKKKKKC